MDGADLGGFLGGVVDGGQVLQPGIASLFLRVLECRVKVRLQHRIDISMRKIHSNFQRVKVRLKLYKHQIMTLICRIFRIYFDLLRCFIILDKMRSMMQIYITPFPTSIIPRSTQIITVKIHSQLLFLPQ